MKTAKVENKKITMMEQHRKESEEKKKQLNKEYKDRHGFTIEEYVMYLHNLEKLHKSNKSLLHRRLRSF